MAGRLDSGLGEYYCKIFFMSDPLHGVKLATILEFLIEELGWEEMGNRINIRCFTTNPSIKSSLTFLRKTPWAREKVEREYLKLI